MAFHVVINGITSIYSPCLILWDYIATGKKHSQNIPLVTWLFKGSCTEINLIEANCNAWQVLLIFIATLRLTPSDFLKCF